jgi:hypothetical protein
MMSFLHPAALFWALVTLPIIGLYVLKIRLRRVPVSTSLFWREIFDQKQTRAWWQHLRHLVSLLAQLLLVALLVFALAEPFFSGEALEARRLVLVIDHSASMNATDVVPSRLAVAKEKAREVVERLRFRDELAIVRAGTQAEVVCGFTNQPRALRQAIAGIAPSDSPLRIAEAIELARGMLAAGSQGGDEPRRSSLIVVVTDGCFPEAKGFTESGDVRLVLVGQAAGNVGITRFQARRSLLDPIGYELFIEVTNAADLARTCRLDVTLDDLPVDSIPLHLQPGEHWQKVLVDQRSVEGGKLIARLDHADPLASDNVAFALLPPRAVQKVNLVTDDSTGSLFVEKVLEASPLMDVAVLAWQEGDELPPAFLNVFHRHVPRRLPPGPVLLIDPQASCDVVQVGAAVATPIAAKLNAEHPLMNNVKLDAIVFPRARQLTLADRSALPLATSIDGEPLLVALERREGRVLVLTAMLDPLTDLPLRTAFPILVNNALSWFAGQRGEMQEALATGSVTTIDLPPDDARRAVLRITPPTGQARELPAGLQRFTLGPLDQVGVWSVGWRQGQDETQTLRELACNLADRQETDLRPVAQATADLPSPGTGWFQRPPFLILIALAWGLCAVEWFLYQRRWIT